MRQVKGEKECVLTRGGLTDMAGAMKLAAVAQKTVFLPKEKARPSLGKGRLLSHSQGPCGPAK